MRRHLATTAALLLGVLAATLGLVAASASPAAACSCVGGGIQTYARWSDVVFTGELVGHEGDGVGQRTTYTFEVDRVFEGETEERAEVESASSGAACGLERMEEGRRYLVFASREDEGLQSGLCSGTQRVSKVYVDRVAERVGEPRPPADVADPPSDDEPDASAGAHPFDDDGMGGKTLPLALLAGGAAAVIVGALLAGARRVGREGRSGAAAG